MFLRSPVKSFIFRWIFGCGVTFFFLAIGMVIFFYQNKQNTWNLSNEERIYVCQLTETPIEKEKTFLCPLALIASVDNSNYIPVKKSIIAYISKDSLSANLQPGVKLLIKANVSPPKNNGNPEEFDYAFYLKQQGFSGIAFVKQTHWKIIENSGNPTIQQLALRCRSHLLSIYESLNLSSDEKAIVSAITLGYKEDLSPELKQRFSIAGVNHILSVSGLHVGIIFLITNFLLYPIGRNNKKFNILKYGIILIFLWCFAFITGLPPSVIRATTMFSLATIALILNRKSSIFNTICVSAFGMLLYNPFYLFHIGFQLSYLAVFSIVLLQPYLQQSIQVKNPIIKPIWALVTVSIAAQIGTCPLVLYYFHQFPTYFIFANLLVIPITYLITAFAILSLFLESFFGNSWFIKDLLEYCLSFMNNSITVIEQLPYASIQPIWLNQIEVILVFLLLFSCFLFYLKKHFANLTIFFCSLIILLISFNIKLYQSERQSSIAFFYQKESPAINIIHGKNNYLLTEDTTRIAYTAKSYWMKNKVKQPILLTESMIHDNIFYDKQFIHFKSKSIVVLTNNDLSNYQSSIKLPVDYLVIGKGFSSKLEQITQLISPKEIILDASLPPYVSNRLQQECKEQRISYQNITEEGALVLQVH